MDRYRKLAEMMRKQFPDAGKMILFNAIVKSIEDESCTVEVDGLEIDEVRLKATINGETNKMLLEPKIGSMVLVGSLTGDLKDIAVLKVDEMAKLHYAQDGLEVLVDSTDQKIRVANDGVSLVDVFQQLADLLKAFKVYTPAGPSGTALPDTVVAINDFENDFKQILK